MAGTFLFYDYETDGADPQYNRPYQFAYIRTDEDLQPVPGREGEGITLWCRPPEDRLPSPEAVLITGITPQHAAVEGQTERAFFGEIHRLFNTPGTTSLGWNSIRFDETVSRFGFWRNFLDPYAHSWQAGCRFWDLIDVARACYALRPEGIVWPAYVDDDWTGAAPPLAPADGSPAFKLDMLAPANGIEHSGAHDALADVRASIAFARLMRSRQPRLWDSAREMVETKVAEARLASGRPLLHVSPKIPNAVGCASLVHVVSRDPKNRKEFITWDLRHDPTDLLEADPDTIHARTFARKDDLPDGVERFTLKGIKSNHAPFVLEASKPLMASIDTARIGLDLDACRRHYAMLKEAPGDLAERIAAAFTKDFPQPTDVDDMLYAGFIDNAERRRCDVVATTDPEELRGLERTFRDHRLPELLLHYRARNFPDTLDDAELKTWHARCGDRLQAPPGRGQLAWPAWLDHLHATRNDSDLSDEDRAHLDATEDWGRRLAAKLDLAVPTG